MRLGSQPELRFAATMRSGLEKNFAGRQVPAHAGGASLDAYR